MVNILTVVRSSQESCGFSHERFKSKLKELSKNNNICTEIRAIDKKYSGIEFIPTIGYKTQSASIVCFVKLVIRCSVEY